MCSPRKKRAARGAGAAWLVGVLLISVKASAYVSGEPNVLDGRADNPSPSLDGVQGALSLPLRRWNSAACQHYYSGAGSQQGGPPHHAPAPEVLLQVAAVAYPPPSDMSGFPTARSTLPFMTSLEDRCKRGRDFSSTGPKIANEIIIIHELKLIYLITRKTACSTLRSAIDHTFRVSMTNCGCPARNGCKFMGRCTAACLSQQLVEEYFIFAVVRDPITRCPSQLRQASIVRHWSNFEKSGAAVRHMQTIADNFVSGACGNDYHMESQALSLSSRWGVSQTGNGSQSHHTFGGRMPIDFLLRMENLSEDFGEMLRIAAKHTGRDLTRAKRDTLLKYLDNQHRRNVSPEPQQADVLEKLHQICRDVYKQDIACFTYYSNASDVALQTMQSNRKEKPGKKHPRINASNVLLSEK